MSNGRKVKVEFTQAEASALLGAYLFICAISLRPKTASAEHRAYMKIQHQLNAVRGKVSGGAV